MKIKHGILIIWCACTFVLFSVHAMNKRITSFKQENLGDISAEVQTLYQNFYNAFPDDYFYATPRTILDNQRHKEIKQRYALKKFADLQTEFGVAGKLFGFGKPPLFAVARSKENEIVAAIFFNLTDDHNVFMTGP